MSYEGAIMGLNPGVYKVYSALKIQLFWWSLNPLTLFIVFSFLDGGSQRQTSLNYDTCQPILPSTLLATNSSVDWNTFFIPRTLPKSKQKQIAITLIGWNIFWKIFIRGGGKFVFGFETFRTSSIRINSKDVARIRVRPAEAVLLIWVRCRRLYRVTWPVRKWLS